MTNNTATTGEQSNKIPLLHDDFEKWRDLLDESIESDTTAADLGVEKL